MLLLHVIYAPDYSTMKQIETQDHFTATADYVTKFLSEQTTVAK